MKSAIFITIRLDSSRLKEKTLLKILGVPVITHIVNRAKLAKGFDEVIVCTTNRSVDDIIVKISENNGVKVFRGSLEDKLERWNGAAKKYFIDYIVTFDGDDLFCDPYLLEKGLKQIVNSDVDFIESPKGLVCGAFTYAFTSKALEKVCKMKDSTDTEMMWTYFKDSGCFKTDVLENVEGIYYSDDIRLTLDYPEDFDFFCKVFTHFNCINNDVPLKEIIRFLNNNPIIKKININRQQDFLDNQKRKTKLVLKKGARHGD